MDNQEIKKELVDLRRRYKYMDDEDIDEKLDELINKLHDNEERHHPVS